MGAMSPGAYEKSLLIIMIAVLFMYKSDRRKMMSFRIGLCQMGGSDAQDIYSNKQETWQKASSMVRRAKDAGCDIVCLPEMWNTPYANRYFEPYAETEDGETVSRMSALAGELGIYLAGGTISEREENRVYNTAYVFDRNGRIIGKHRKAHLFDVDIEGGIRFMESETLSSGDCATVIDTEFGRIGIAICFDVRFPEFFRKMTLEGAKMVILPAAFSKKTGTDHWHLAMRSRAVDNQVYFAAVSPAYAEGGIYEAYGHSLVSDPWGKVIAEAGTGEEIVYADIDFEYVDSVRQQLPLLRARRPEIY